MKRKALLSVSAVIAATMLAASPAYAAEFTSADGNISIELPGDDWYEVIDPEAEFVFTNGRDVISAYKYDPDETAEVERNNEYYNAVVQLSYAYSDQLIVLTAEVVDAPHLPEVYQAVTSIKFKSITEKDESKKDVNNYEIVDEDMTLYVNAPEGLNLRQNFSVTSDIMDILPHGTAVHVTGVVKYNGEEIGWVRAEYEGMTGFVSAGNLVATTDEVGNNPIYDEAGDGIDHYVTMYHADGTPEKVIVLNTGSRIDVYGNRVVGFADGACQMQDGTIIYAFDPTQMSVDDWMMGGVTEETEDYVAPEALGTDFNNPAAGEEILVCCEWEGVRMITLGKDSLWYDKYGEVYGYDKEKGIWKRASDQSPWYYCE